MKLLLILVVGCLTVTASITDVNDSRIHRQNGWCVPCLNETLYWMEKEKAESNLEPIKKDEYIDWSITTVKFYLFTKSNPTQGQKITKKPKSVYASNFNPIHPTRFVIHGARQTYLSNSILKIRDAWLAVGQYNVIVVDWRRAHTPYHISAITTVPKAGQKVAKFIKYLAQTHSLPLYFLQVIGYGLGAHVAGYAGKELKNDQIHTIIGLDPALPLFNYKEPERRLTNTDAFYVETIQTNCGIMGFKEPIGTASFYPNGGIIQPNCLISACDHKRSIDYYVESIVRDNFAAIRCNSYKDAINKNCGNVVSSIRMGGHKDSFLVSGVFIVPVNEKPPYGVLNKSEMHHKLPQELLNNNYF